MQNTKILTISVAAYNLGDLIRNNLESFIASKYKELIEVIVTNDGSTDNTKEIVEEYEKKYPEVIRLINKKNEGAGSTVNSGIKNASGKYFKMIDGDDWVNTENLDSLIEKLINEDVDMVFTDYVVYSSVEKKIVDYKKIDGVIPNKKMQIKDLKKNTLFAMHNILYKTSLLQNNSIILDNGFYTDQEYMIYPLKYVNSFIYYDLDIYVYMIGREGQSVNINSFRKHIDTQRMVFDNLINDYTKNKENLKNSSEGLIRSRIAKMARYHMDILLSLDMTNENVKRIQDFCKYIKKADIEIYNEFKKGKKESCIINSGYLLTKPIAEIYKKRNGY